MLQQMTKIKGIAVFSTGYEWVDLQYLKSRGIMLSYLPDYCTISVAEHTIGMILTLSRRLHLSYEFANKRIDKTVSLRGFELFQKKAGIIGYGKIGMKIAELLKSFGVYISWFDIQKENKDLCGYCDLDKLLNESDIVIIAASKKRDSKPIIDDHAIAKMKQNVVIVNSARADLVDNHAIARGLKNNKIFSYAVDDIIPLFKQLEIEPGRIFETSHTAWYSTEALARGINDWVDNIIGLAQNNYRNIIDI
jgi:lactate dehydrogenase-like 2-hydroxyacid dehydrogenase